VRHNFLRWFAEYEGPIGLETRDLDIAAGEDIAFAHMLPLDTGNAHLSEAWIRSTVCIFHGRLNSIKKAETRGASRHTDAHAAAFLLERGSPGESQRSGRVDTGR
jgi:hypothetical protein